MAKKLLIAAIFTLFTGYSCLAQEITVGTNFFVKDDSDICLGDENAPVTIIEYSSFTCAHCADFHSYTLPILKEKYIDHGKIQLVFRHFPMDREAFKASVLVACVPAEKRHNLLTQLFINQEKWLSQDSTNALAELAGIKVEQFKQCLNDKKMQENVLRQSLHAQQHFELHATPTFFINGKMFAGAPTLEEIEETMETITQ